MNMFHITIVSILGWIMIKAAVQFKILKPKYVIILPLSSMFNGVLMEGEVKEPIEDMEVVVVKGEGLDEEGRPQLKKNITIFRGVCLVVGTIIGKLFSHFMLCFQWGPARNPLEFYNYPGFPTCTGPHRYR